MRIIRYLQDKNAPRYGWVLDDKVGAIEGDLFGEYSREEVGVPMAEVSLLPPLQPSKIVCVGRNYAAHAEEYGADVPEVPLLFLKPPSSIIGDGGTILLPPQSERVEHEAELGVVIGRRGRWIAAEEAKDYVLGYTVANDVTARDLQRKDEQWTRGKGFDTFCPVGPWIDTRFDPSNALITCRVNDELRQMAPTQDMVFTVRDLIAYASSVMTLEPGDLLLTGTPSGVGLLQPGDEVAVEIDGLGELRNQVEKDER